MKTGPLASAYTLAGKGRDDFYYYYSDFNLRILPSGAIRASLVDTNKAQWTAETVGRTYDPTTGRWLLKVDNNEWHHLAMVCNRETGRLIIYIDGVERASSNKPANFGPTQNMGNPFRAGIHSYYDGWGGGTIEFPGIIDEVRFSTTAHSQEKIIASMQGEDVNRVNSIQPWYIQKAAGPVTVTILGYGLAGATLTTDQPDVSVTVTSSSSSQIVSTVNVPSTVPIGQLHFTVTNTSGQSFPAS